MSLDNDLKDWYAVYPGSEKLDLGEKRPIAYFRVEKHAEEFAKMYRPFGYVEYMGAKEFVEAKTEMSKKKILELVDLYRRNKR